MQYGGINVGIIGPTNESFNYDTNAYYTGDLTEGFGHAICIVGWDDDFSKDNFEIKPEHDGAWIAVNSWSENWGDQGYFYISYDDKYKAVEYLRQKNVKKNIKIKSIHIVKFLITQMAENIMQVQKKKIQINFLVQHLKKGKKKSI